MNKWFKNVSFSLIGKIIAMACLMLLDVVAARLLKIEAYAEWVYFFSILTMLFWIGWFGINTSVKVFASKCRNLDEQASCIKSAAVLRVVVSFCVSCLIVLILPKCASYLGYPDKYPSLKSLFYMAAILVFFNSFTEFFKEFFMGTDRFKYLFAITVVEYAGYLVFSLISLLIVREVKSITVGYLVSGVIVSVIGWVLLLRIYKEKIGNAEVAFDKYILPILKYAIPIALISLGGMILVEMDTFMLGLLSTKENVAVYSIAKNLCQKATHLNYSLTVGVMTSFSVITADTCARQKIEFNKAARLNMVITGIVSLAFLVLGQVAINIIYGSEYTRSGYIIRQLVIYYALYGISNFYSTFLDFRNKAGSRSRWYLSVVIINLILNYLWIPRYGAEGAAWATDLSLLPYTLYAIVATSKEWKCSNENFNYIP